MKSLLLIFYLTSAIVLLSVNGKKHSRRQGSFGFGAGGGSKGCKTPTGEIGTCVRLRNCWTLYSKFQAGDRSPEFIDLLRRSACRYERNEPIICCPGTSRGTPAKPHSTKPHAAMSHSLTKPNTASSQSCGIRSSDANRIVNGVPAKKGAWPWIAALGYSGLRGRLDFLCGGALITNRHILTAAHCVINREDLSVVRLGSHTLKNDTVGSYEEIKISQKILHEEYNTNSFENDIAILTLEKPVQFKDTISPICLPTGSFFRSNPLTPLNGAIAGWGAIDYEGPSSSVLMEARVPIRINEECKQSYSVFSKIVIDSRSICAGNGLSDTCQGDSGGPLMVYDPTTKTYNVAGVVSVGYKCAEKGFPGIYTRVTSFMDWIKEKTQ